ncbi:hypothetical protein EVAR_91745_1 [Eumeta japonica]|uniref:Uncharacterized protein n=1 Tax=Eumeta variegata TaxID=151549 RepID=A0A4C2AHG9_EUMVA|nr:hypothetical protein EVAR_91745_1 [Eumeta japonica]
MHTKGVAAAPRADGEPLARRINYRSRSGAQLPARVRMTLARGNGKKAPASVRARGNRLSRAIRERPERPGPRDCRLTHCLNAVLAGV